MQIHELNNYSGSLESGAYLAVDDGVDTGKVSVQAITEPLNARIDNIITSPAPTQQEIIDAREGINGTVYSSLGDAIRDQIGTVSEDLGEAVFSVANYNDWQTIDVPGSWKAGDIVYIRPISDNLVSFVNIARVVSGAPTTMLANQPTLNDYYITLPVDCDAIRVAYRLTSVVQNTKYSAIVAKVGEENDAFGIAITNKHNVTSLKQSINCPFDLDGKSSTALNILTAFLGVEVYDTQYEKYAFRYIWHNNAGFDLYMNLYGFDGESWVVANDSIERTTAQAPNPRPNVEAISSRNGKFRVLINWDAMPDPAVLSSDPIWYSLRTPAISFTDYASIIAKDTGSGNYELQDNTKHIVTVKQDGTGDYTSIAAAYAAITDSSFSNQYEVVVYPGTYSEYNLACPPYTHTHGLHPGTVVVTSEGVSSTLPVFEQRNAPSKLSNMTIISGTGYCVHQDANLDGIVLVNENLYCKKVYGVPVPNFSWQQITNPAVLGMGVQYNGSKFVWKDCTFEDGEAACHTNSGAADNSNHHIIFKDCKLVNAWIWLGVAGNSGASMNSFCVAELNGVYAPKGCPTLKAKLGARLNDESNYAWQIIGGNNKNFSIIWDNTSDSLTSDLWENINTNEKAFVQLTGSVSKGQWIDDSMSVCQENENLNNIIGIALEGGDSGDTVSVWTGNAYRFASMANGEYGIGSNGELSLTASNKIGKVINNILYRY